MTATTTANKLAEALKSEISHRTFTGRVWAPADADFARVYTGSRGEYIQVEADGTLRTSQSRMSWGYEIRDAAERLGLEIV